MSIHLHTEHISATTLMKEEILANDWYVACFFRISTTDEVLDLHSLYWIPELHNSPYKQGLTYSMQHLSKFLAVCFGVHVMLATPWLMWIRFRFWQIWKICYSTYNLCSSSNSINRFHFFPPTQVPTLQ